MAGEGSGRGGEEAGEGRRLTDGEVIDDEAGRNDEVAAAGGGDDGEARPRAKEDGEVAVRAGDGGRGAGDAGSRDGERRRGAREGGGDDDDGEEAAKRELGSLPASNRSSRARLSLGRFQIIDGKGRRKARRLSTWPGASVPVFANNRDEWPIRPGCWQ